MFHGFKKIATQCVARGWSVLPLVPGNKLPLTKRGFHDARADEASINKWDAWKPSANVGIACGMSNLTVVDVDEGLVDEAAWRAWCERVGLPPTYTVRTGRRPGFGVQMYYSGTMADIGLFELEGCKGQIKSLGGLVVAAGCLHPSGELYAELNSGALAPLPEIIRSLKKAKSHTDGERTEKIKRGEGQHAYMISLAGKLRNMGMSPDTIYATMIPVSESELDPPLPLEDLRHMADSASKWDVPAAEPKLVMGKAKEPETDVELLDDTDAEPEEPRPLYPDEIWEGTAYGEFADLCTSDNQIPKKFFSEAFRTIVGAIMGDKLISGLQDVSPRAYTILIAPPGKGKGTSCSRALEFFTKFWQSQRGQETPLLFRGTSIHRSSGIGAQIVSPASAPGLMMALAPEKKSGKDKSSVNPALETWTPLPRIITINEEIRTLFANFSLEATGAGLESALCELFDRTSFSATATAQRKQAAGEAMYSILGAITRDGWDSVFAKSSSVESGFLSRVNIIASEGEFPLSAQLDELDYEPLRTSFLPRLLELRDRPAYVRPTPSARALMTEWFAELDPPQAFLRTRLNIHAWRTALHIAWLRRSDYIDNEHVRAAIKAAEYQIKMREFYAPAEGDTRGARCQANIRRVMRAKKRLKLRELKPLTNAHRTGLADWNKALKVLEAAGELRVNGSEVILLKQKD